MEKEQNFNTGQNDALKVRKEDLPRAEEQKSDPKQEDFVRKDLVEKYRKLIKENRYTVPSQDIADALTRKLFE